MKKVLLLTLCLVMMICLLAGCSKEVTVDTTGLVNIKSSGEPIAKTKESYTAVLTADQYYALPKNITITMDGVAITEGYVYNPTTGELIISEEAVTGNISISAKADCIPVSVDTQNLYHISTDGSAEGLTMTDYTATLTPESGYLLPEEVSVVVDGKALESGYTYDPATGSLTISGKSITGNVEISANAPAEIVGIWIATLNYDTILNDAYAMDPTMAQFAKFEGLNLIMHYEFREDETVSITLDDSSFQVFKERLKVQMKDFIIQFMKYLLELQGIDVSLEDYMAESGVDLDILIEQELGAAFSEEVFAEMERDGFYRLSEGYLYVLEELDDKLEKDGALDYKLEGDTLTIGSEETDPDLAYTFPLELKKVQ